MSKKLKNIKHQKYRNGEVFKYENARVSIVSLPNDEYGLSLKILSSKEDSIIRRSTHTVIKDRIVITNFSISKEAAVSIAYGLSERLKQDKIID